MHRLQKVFKSGGQTGVKTKAVFRGKYKRGSPPPTTRVRWFYPWKILEIFINDEGSRVGLCAGHMPHSHTLTARVSMAWTISRSLGLRVGVGVCVVGGRTTQTAAAAVAYQLSHPL